MVQATVQVAAVLQEALLQEALLQEALPGRAPVGVALPVVMSAGAGVWAGAGARVLLRRLRRGTRIPPPWCELAVAALWAATGAVWAAGGLPGEWVPAVLGLGWLAVAAGAVDLRHRRLPNALTVPAFPVALLLLLPVGPAAVVRGAVGAAVAAAVLVALHLVDRRAVGAGDVKLSAPLGAVLAAVAWPALVLAAVAAASFTAAYAASAAAVTTVLAAVAPCARARAGAGPGPAGPGPPGRWRRTGRAVPHGPSMLLATWLVTVVLLALGVGPGGPGR
ncbi:A24 family peptidase [Pseudonocardia adelaidensis]|uniref:Prepilin type IV endopeptidase peptidase domain-containing protein n=1 Tax=Pseudonocardia adelaidensis TaxID=648754 RepID=A0ABP9NQ14_9PSEU